MRCYAFVLASMYRYSWFITLRFSGIFLDRGVGGLGVSYPNFLGFLYIFYIYKAPKSFQSKTKQLVSVGITIDSPYPGVPN